MVNNRIGKNILTTMIIALILFSIGAQKVVAGSAEGDPAPPDSGSGGGGGGGGPDIFDYYIPLVFNNSHPDGESLVVVWTYTQAVIQTSFAVDESGTTSLRVDEPTKFVFRPSTSSGLTNGSLIRIIGTPAQVIGARLTEDIYSDISFSYTILPARMMGFEYTAPFNGTASIITRSSGAVLKTDEGGGSIEPVLPFSPYTLNVTKGQYFNSSQPILVAFYKSDETGTVATLGVPNYLRGDNYLFDGDILSLGADETDMSYIRIIADVPTEVNISYSDGSISEIIVIDSIDITLDENIVGLFSLRGKITVTINLVVAYGAITRASAIQLIAASEMRAGELFKIPDTFSTHFTVVNDHTNLTVLDYLEDQFIVKTRELPVLNSGDSFVYNSPTDPELIIANHSMFSFSTSPGKNGHPMSHSASFLNLPLNTGTIYREVDDASATWYRFTNLAVLPIEMVPVQLEEFSGVKVIVTFISNGSIPASSFSVSVTIEDKEEFTKSYDFLGVNETIVLEFDIFLEYGRKNIEVSAIIDTESEVSEINEDDNSIRTVFEIGKNARLIVTAYLLAAIITIYVVYILIRSIRNRSKREEGHYDAILNIEEVDQ